MEAPSVPPGVTFVRVDTTREDNVVMDFSDAGDEPRHDRAGRQPQRGLALPDRPRPAQTFRFRARSRNGGLREQSITVNGGT